MNIANGPLKSNISQAVVTTAVERELTKLTVCFSWRIKCTVWKRCRALCSIMKVNNSLEDCFLGKHYLYSRYAEKALTMVKMSLKLQIRCYLSSATDFFFSFLPLCILVFRWDLMHLVPVHATSDIRLNKASPLSFLSLCLSIFWCWYSRGMQSWIPLQGWRQQSKYTVCGSCCPAKYVHHCFIWRMQKEWT